MGTKCFMIEPIAKQYQWLRRYKFGGAFKCVGSTGGLGGHDASARIENAISAVPKPGEYESFSDFRSFALDPRWPLKCDSCDYRFVDADERQLFDLRVYADAQGREFGLPGHLVRDVAVAPAGAMWWAWWHHADGASCWWTNCTDPRGHLNVVCPGGHIWDIDSRASNCTMRNDRTHRCWIRHGEPPSIHVDKNGNTCAAGAGSIVAGDYHGFLQNGELT